VNNRKYDARRSSRRGFNPVFFYRWIFSASKALAEVNYRNYVKFVLLAVYGFKVATAVRFSSGHRGLITNLESIRKVTFEVSL